MTITLSAEVERVLKERAEKLGSSPDELVNEALRQAFLTRPTDVLPPPRDDWERRLRRIGVSAGVSLTNGQLSRESIYED